MGSSKYFEEHARHSHPKELVDRACFGQIFPRGNRLPWPFERSGEEVEITPSGPIFTTEPHTQLQAARNGLGLALLFVEHCQADLTAGTLEAVLEDWCQPFAGPYLYYPERRRMPSPLRASLISLKGPDLVRAAAPTRSCSVSLRSLYWPALPAADQCQFGARTAGYV